jgi:hypothetical protein
VFYIDSNDRVLAAPFRAMRSSHYVVMFGVLTVLACLFIVVVSTVYVRRTAAGTCGDAGESVSVQTDEGDLFEDDYE